jgi:hypothetical protein
MSGCFGQDPFCGSTGSGIDKRLEDGTFLECDILACTADGIHKGTTKDLSVPAVSLGPLGETLLETFAHPFVKSAWMP